MENYTNPHANNETKDAINRANIPWSSLHIKQENYTVNGDSARAFHMYKYKTDLKLECEGPNRDMYQNNLHSVPSTSRSRPIYDTQINNHFNKCNTCGKSCLNSELYQSCREGVAKSYCYDCVDKLTEDLMKPGARVPPNCPTQQCTNCMRIVSNFNYKSNYDGEPFSCDVCTKKPQLSTASADKTAGTSPAVLRDKQFECNICSKQFTQLAHLKTHKLIHTGEKSFQCETCFKKFTRKSGLDVHKLIHSGEKLYRCDVCSMRFVQPSHLKTHKLTHTGERSFECELCFKKFSRKSGLDVHKLIHSGEKLYKCEMCLKRFVQPSHLNTHRLTHTGEKPFQCNICMKRFNRSSLLRKHEMSHKKQNLISTL